MRVSIVRLEKGQRQDFTNKRLRCYLCFGTPKVEKTTRMGVYISYSYKFQSASEIILGNK